MFLAIGLGLWVFTDGAEDSLAKDCRSSSTVGRGGGRRKISQQCEICTGRKVSTYSGGNE